MSGLTLRDTTAWKKRGKETKNKKRVRRRADGEHGPTMNSVNGRPPLTLASQRDSVDLPAGRGRRREILTPIFSGTFPTDSRRSPIHPPPTSSPSHAHTFTHSHRHTVSPVNVNCLGLSVDCTISPHSQIRFQQTVSFTLLEGFKEKLFFFVLSTFIELVLGIWFSYPGVVQMQVEVFFFL